MSWDAYLVDDRGHVEGEWNYTHNCNGMANLALNPNYEQRPVAEEVFRFRDAEHVSWWKHLDGKSGYEGTAFLNGIVEALEAEPDKYRALNPPNGWGDYDGFLKILREMATAVPEWPTVWQVHG